MLRAQAKKFTAHVARSVMPQIQYGNMIFVLSHMRAATTAFSNVLCSHSSISGYGETHVSYTSDASAGQTAVNIMRRGAWRSGGRYIFDKVLHNELDETPPEAFLRSRAIFLIRAPRPTVRSIERLAQTTGQPDYNDPTAAAEYYLKRVQRLETLWRQFPAQHRLGISTEDLLSDPDLVISKTGRWLQMSPALQNEYRSHPAAQRAGGGDPIRSAQSSKIETVLSSKDFTPIPNVAPDLSDRCLSAYRAFLGNIAETTAAWSD